MSIEADNVDSELSTKELLQLILDQLILLNHRYEEATNTGISEEDL